MLDALLTRRERDSAADEYANAEIARAYIHFERPNRHLIRPEGANYA